MAQNLPAVTTWVWFTASPMISAINGISIRPPFLFQQTMRAFLAEVSPMWGRDSSGPNRCGCNTSKRKKGPKWVNFSPYISALSANDIVSTATEIKENIIRNHNIMWHIIVFELHISRHIFHLLGLESVLFIWAGAKKVKSVRPLTETRSSMLAASRHKHPPKV